ncbi:MAG: hypothetical protein KGI38_12680 [Thaumarchaeota archaeon]|nr:hypothetical protein [Nitrososphaerota archaeon]
MRTKSIALGIVIGLVAVVVLAVLNHTPDSPILGMTLYEIGELQGVILTAIFLSIVGISSLLLDIEYDYEEEERKEERKELIEDILKEMKKS